MTTRNQVVIAIVGAAVAGIVFGLLAAPEKGKETRKKIREKTGKWVDDMGRLISQKHPVEQVTKKMKKAKRNM
jgi:gas vesicle protein